MENVNKKKERIKEDSEESRGETNRWKDKWKLLKMVQQRKTKTINAPIQRSNLIHVYGGKGQVVDKNGMVKGNKKLHNC